MTNTPTADTATTWIDSEQSFDTFTTRTLASDPARGGCAFIAFTGENNGRNIDHASLNVHNVARITTTVTDVSVNGNGTTCVSIRIHNGGIATEVCLFGHDVLATLRAAIDSAEVLS